MSLNIADEVGVVYEEVRSDNNDTSWALFGYDDDTGAGDGTTIVVLTKGTGGMAELSQHLKENERAYGFLRVITGDDMSARAKFVFISWVPNRTPIRKKAQVSTHKAFVTEVIKDFAVNIHASDADDLDEEDMMKQVRKAGGANYGSSTS